MEFKLITPESIIGTHFDTMAAILDFFSSRLFSEGITKIIALLTLTRGLLPLVGPKGPPALRRS